MAGIVPAWIVRGSGVRPGWPTSGWGWTGLALGVLVLLAGLALFSASLRRFGAEGKGTLAPWDPPVRLVVGGPYAFVRNPMISGVLLVLVAEGLLLRSLPVLQWAGAFFLVNAVWIPLVEEPGLRARFGASYDEYARAVPRLIPRLRPWRRS